MKRFIWNIFFLLVAVYSFGLTYHVTVPAGTKACYIAGEMNGWSHQVMNKVDETHYTLDIPAATSTQQYKYCSGPSWAYVETLANNRSYTANDVVTSWAAIYDPFAIPVDVVYTVTVPAGTYTCYFAGGATNWVHKQMAKVDETHFSITINTTIPNGYKYCSGPDWIYEELDANSQTISDRNYSQSDVVAKWKEVYNPNPTGLVYNVTVPAGTKACYIAGEMNNWTHQAMTKVDETHYFISIDNATTAMKYKYCSGPDWNFQELNADNSAVANRSYSSSDAVAKWSTIWDPAVSVLSIPNTLKLSSGRVDRYSFNNSSIGVRTVDVWLPNGYTLSKKYAVLYMHDGQMLFDATSTWNNQEWKVDETLSQLMQNGSIPDVIVVGIWNSSNRYSEYYPEKSMDYLTANVKTAKLGEMNNDPKGDEYLSFLVNKVKPFIDLTYSVNTNTDHTFVAGSSMGGLISWYALCEYPNIFGGAVCMSTHWGVIGTDDPSIPDSFRKYLLAKLPSPTNHKIYFDHGTIGLDANYEANQQLVDTVMKYKGYSSSNWETLVYQGDDHNEVSWANRLNVPMKFILTKDNSSSYSLNLNPENLNGKGFACGSTVALNWTSNGVQNIKIEYSTDNGSNWTVIASSADATVKSFSWIVPTITSTTCKIRISDVANASTKSESNLFTIAPAITYVTFSVDASILINDGKFNTTTDKMYIRGSFNGFDLTHVLNLGSNNIYSLTIPLPSNTYVGYKYFSTAANAENGGWEIDFPVTSSKNRSIYVGENNLTLATVYYNDGEMNLSKSSAHFNVIYSSQDNNLIDQFVERIELFHSIVASSLEVNPTEKTNIFLYKDLDHLHLAQGYPENDENSTGSAYGKSLFIMLSPAKMGLNEGLGLFAHEYTHCLNAWKTKVTLPAWLNEGVACYFGRQISTKDWIKSITDQRGKPAIQDVFNTDMGYAYSFIVAYYLIKTKGMPAMAKFIENMNYSDIGYSGLPALQNDWNNFLDVYLNTQTNVNVKFSVNMTDMIAAGYFNPATDKVYVKGDWNWWNGQQMALETGNIYSISVPINTYSFNEYKFYTNSPTAPNGGLELNTDETIDGNRLLDIFNEPKTLNTVQFKSNAIPSIANVDMKKISDKVQVLKFHGRIWNAPSFNTFKYPFKLISPTEYQSQKPSDAFSFESGFVGTNDTIYISEPMTTEQIATFNNVTNVALYYLCQAYLFHYYQTRNMPLIFKVGFPLYEAGLMPSDETVKTAANAYGGSFASFDALNNRSTFISNNGKAVAGAFGEFMNIFKNWGYGMISSINANSFDVLSYWGNVNDLSGLLGDFNRYVNYRFLQTDENLRVKMVKETEHFKFYTRPVDYALNFPYFSDVLEPAFVEYTTNFNLNITEKFSYFTLPTCIDGEIEGVPCNGLPPSRITGGTAWSSGMHSTCASTQDELPLFYHMNRHELAHGMQGNMPQGTVTAWLNEGFPQFCASGPIDDTKLIEIAQSGIECMNAAVNYFGHRPTYEETRIYPSPDYGYYTLGYFLIDYQYRRGGYPLVKAIQMNDLAAYQSLGYSSSQAFLEDFYFDFDVRVKKLPIATLIKPVTNMDENNPIIQIAWTPLKADVKLNVYVSTDDAKTWTKIADHITETSCIWNAENIISRFYLKIEALDNMNLSSLYGPFVKGDLTKLNFISPMIDNYVIAGDTMNIKWGTTSIQQIKLEYATNVVPSLPVNASDWKTITGDISTAASNYRWAIPATLEGTCKLKITDTSNANNFSESDIFNLVKPNETGGPYLYDKNTLLLLHFDNDLNNRSLASGNAVGDIQNLTSDNNVSQQFGKSYRTISNLTVPHHVNLNLTGDWTLEAWVKLNSFTGNDMYLFWKPGDSDSYISNYSLEINPWWGNIFFGYYFSQAKDRIGLTTTFSPSLNEWYHVAYIRNTAKNQMQLIVHDKNRNLISAVDLPYSPNETLVNSKDLIIGANLDGYMDEVRISNVVRSFVSTGVNDLKKESIFKVYPNPTEGMIHFSWKEDCQNGKIKIFNVNGQNVYSTDIKGLKNNSIDLNYVSKGIYFIQVTNKNEVYTEKIVKQ